MSLAALVFDFDGLILDTEWPEYQSVSEVYAEFGLTLPLEEWQEIVGTADHPHWTEMLQTALGQRVDADDLRERRRLRHHHLIGERTIRPGVVDLLDAADTADLALAVASSSPSSWVEGHLERLGLRDRFSAVHCRDHVERPKPAPDLYELAVATIGCTPAQAVALEDSRHGATAARAAGLWCVVVPNDVTRTQNLDPAHRVVDSLAALDLRDLRDLLR